MRAHTFTHALAAVVIQFRRLEGRDKEIEGAKGEWRGETQPCKRCDGGEEERAFPLSLVCHSVGAVCR